MKKSSILLYEPDRTVKLLLLRLFQRNRIEVEALPNLELLLRKIAAEKARRKTYGQGDEEGEGGVVILGEPEPSSNFSNEFYTLPRRFPEHSFILLASWFQHPRDTDGFHGMLHKPFTFEELLLTVEKLMEENLAGENRKGSHRCEVYTSGRH